MLPLLLLVALSVAYRLPALLNAGAVDSDAAIVGLQAMHILHGEWSPLLFGSGYQTSVDSSLAALFFLVLGPSPLALMLSTFVGHLVLLGFAYATLRRHLEGRLAALAVLPLVFTPSPLHTYILGPPRQAALTLVFASVWMLDGASLHRRPRLAYAGGAALASLACYADPYALVFAPALALLAAFACLDGGQPPSAVRSRAGACLLGGILGLVPLVLLFTRPDAVHGEAGLRAGLLSHNARLLIDPALPWILSARAYFSGGGSTYGPWHAPWPVRALQITGAVVFLAAILSGAWAFFARRLPWELRRLGLVGASVLPLTVTGFLCSVMVMDLFSTRYLAAIVLASPLAVAPLASRLGARRFGFLLLPYVVSAALAGWLGFGPFVRGPCPVVTRSGRAVDEQLARDELARRGVRFAVADYWVAYRVTFVTREDLIVVPIHASQDRYRPYRDGFDAAPRVAYLFDPERSNESFPVPEVELAGAGPKLIERERLRVGGLTAIVYDRSD